MGKLLEYQKGVYMYPDGHTTARVSGWDIIQKIPVPRLSALPRRVIIENFWEAAGWSYDLEDKYSMITEAIAKETGKNESSMDAVNAKREAYIKEKKEELKDLEEKRKAVTRWEDEQILRCAKGYLAFTPSHYMYYHFGKIQSQEKGATMTISPDYRQIDNFAFRMMRRAVVEKTGFAAVKRRRIGMTWMGVAEVVNAMIFRTASVFFTTHSEDDIIKFLARVKFYIERLPPFLRPEIINDGQRYKAFKTPKRICDLLGMDYNSVPNSVLRTGVPKSLNQFEGEGVAIFIIDEAGLTVNLRQIISAGKPMIAGPNGFDREGALMIWGTVGQMETSGKVFEKVFKSPKTHNIEPVFLKASYGMNLDHAGNECPGDFEERLAKKIEEYESEGNMQEAIRERQLYPLTIKDAFGMNNLAHPWPVQMIAMAEDVYNAHHQEVKYGLFKREPNGSVSFVEQKPNLPHRGHDGADEWLGFNQITMVEDVISSNWKVPYVSGSDPVPYKDRDTGDKFKFKTSDIAVTVWRRHESVGSRGDKPVCYYHGRPDRLSEAYSQILMMTEYYNAPNNIEENKGGGSLYAFYEYNKRMDLIAFGTGIKTQVASRKGYGFVNNRPWWVNSLSIMGDWWNRYPEVGVILPKRVLDECWIVSKDGSNTDVLVSLMAAKQLSDEYTQRESMGLVKIEGEEKPASSMNPWRYENGRLVNVNSPLMRAQQTRNR